MWYPHEGKNSEARKGKQLNGEAVPLATSPKLLLLEESTEHASQALRFEKAVALCYPLFGARGQGGYLPGCRAQSAKLITTHPPGQFLHARDKSLRSLHYERSSQIC